MSIENVKKFYDELAKNEELKKEVMEVQEKFKGEDLKVVVEKVAEEAKKHGFDFTYQDFEEYQNTPHELGDDSLEAVTGGKDVCVCVIGGGGTVEIYGEKVTCACALGGGSSYGNGNIFFCACAIAGGGN